MKDTRPSTSSFQTIFNFDVNESAFSDFSRDIVATDNVDKCLTTFYDLGDGNSSDSISNQQRICLNATDRTVNAPIATADCGDGPMPPAVAVAGAILGSLILATGIFGNVLILASIWRYRPLRKSANAFVASLAVCDLLHTALVRPLYIHTYIAGRWQFGAGTCVYALVASNLAILESILHVTAIAFHRYVALVHPRCVAATTACFIRRHACSLVGFLLAVIYAGPLAVVVAQSWPRLSAGVLLGRDVVFNRRIMFCSFVRHTEFRPIGVVKKAAFVSLNAAFIAFCYIRIYRLVRTRGRRLSVHGGSFNPVRVHRELTLLRTVVAVFIAFVINYIPITLIYGVDTHRTLPYEAYFVSVLLLWVSPSANWIIYGLMNVQYARAYRFVLCRRRPAAGDRAGFGADKSGSRRRSTVPLTWPQNRSARCTATANTSIQARANSDGGISTGVHRSRCSQVELGFASSAPSGQNRHRFSVYGDDEEDVVGTLCGDVTSATKSTENGDRRRHVTSRIGSRSSISSTSRTLRFSATDLLSEQQQQQCQPTTYL